MDTREVTFDVDGGRLTALDYGAPAVDSDADHRQVLLVHGTGQNAAVWNEVAASLTRDAHVVAIDLRGHGRSRASSTDAEQYWHDLATVTASLGWTNPVLVGHSTGGYAVSAVAAADLIDPAAICIIDGFVLDQRESAAQQQAAMTTPQALEKLRTTFKYGWRGTADEARAAIERTVARRGEDWLNAGASAELVRAVAERSYVELPHDAASAHESRSDRAESIRQPSLDEVSAVAAVDLNAEMFPSADVYDQVFCQLVAVLPADGLHAARRAELASIIDARPERELVDIGGGHNVVMTAPGTVSDIISTLLRP